MSESLKLSVQLYSVRNQLAADFDGTLARLAEFGYTRVEPFRFTSFVDDLRSGLSRYHLAAPTTHVGLLAGDQEEIFAAAKELGITTVIDPATDAARWQSVDDIKAIAGELNAAAEKAASHGVRVGYHNHYWELESVLDGKRGLEILADNLAPEVVLEVDTFWAYVGGADVPALLGRLGERVVALHIKDGDGSRDTKKQVAVGSGVLPVWDFIAAAPDDVLFVVELDDSSGDLLQAVRDSLTYLTAGRES
ncbi:MAG TPA: sugar phosphate isomerase/epimerase [Propionibacteriaceae bacterium]|nr:sugar phosphate isomerase/epimerase [Propionibacteriaceae bacterium]